MGKKLKNEGLKEKKNAMYAKFDKALDNSDYKSANEAYIELVKIIDPNEIAVLAQLFKPLMSKK